MGVVTCKDLVKKYRGNQVINIADLKIKENTITGLMVRVRQHC